MAKMITDVKGVGEKYSKLLGKLDIYTVWDLIKYYPKRYKEYKTPTNLENICTEISEIKTIIAMPIKPLVTKLVGRYNITTTVLSDEVNNLKVIWYNSKFLTHSIKPFKKYVFIGKIIKKGSTYELSHPEVYEIEAYKEIEKTLMPIYLLTKGITNNFLIKLLKGLLKENVCSEYLPDFIKKKFSLIDLENTYSRIHFPKDMNIAISARKRLVFDEFFLFLLAIKKLNKDRTLKQSHFHLKNLEEVYSEFCSVLPFELTDSQKDAVNNIFNDFKSGKVMNRLLQGDVGSGKTVIALIALLACTYSGYQASIMVPTEVLAMQHFKSMSKLIEKLSKPPRIALLTGSMTKKEHLKVYEQIRNHDIDILIGTHALIMESVEFDNLALVITDEQHRFGVRQRQDFAKKGFEVHTLVMSATPIPRTLAVILYADLDISNIVTKPVGRLPIKNAVIEKKDREKAYLYIKKQIEKGHQAYVICPMVEESESIDAENVIDYTEVLKKYFANSISIKFLHGKMLPSEKDKIMNEFAEGKIQILVSTTVVEVGVDVANATVMMIENAERFGLATLHQLRGRVGRSSLQSYCIFVKTSNSKSAKQRLEVVGNSNDGFFIASEDLRLRGPGEIFGMAQSGDLAFEIADIFRDFDVLKQAKEAVDLLENAEIDAFSSEKISKKLDEYQSERLDKLSL